MYEFDIPKKKPLSSRGRRPYERKVIKGIICKKCPICGQWIPETEFHKAINASDGKQGYCKRCKALYCKWYLEVCKQFKVSRLSDIPGFVQPERGEEMKRYVTDLLKFGYTKEQIKEDL